MSCHPAAGGSLVHKLDSTGWFGSHIKRSRFLACPADKCGASPLPSTFPFPQGCGTSVPNAGLPASEASAKKRSVLLGRDGEPSAAAAPGPHDRHFGTARGPLDSTSARRHDLHHRTTFTKTFLTAVALGRTPPLAGRCPCGRSVVTAPAPGSLVPLRNEPQVSSPVRTALWSHALPRRGRPQHRPLPEAAVDRRPRGVNDRAAHWTAE